MEKNLEQFLKDVRSDETLKKECADAKFRKDEIDRMIAFAAEHGYTVTEQEIKDFENNELSAEELDKIAGGTDTEDIIFAVCAAITYGFAILAE